MLRVRSWPFSRGPMGYFPARSPQCGYLKSMISPRGAVATAQRIFSLYCDREAIAFIVRYGERLLGLSRGWKGATMVATVKTYSVLLRIFIMTDSRGQSRHERKWSGYARASSRLPCRK